MGEPLRGSFGYVTIGLSGAIPPQSAKPWRRRFHHQSLFSDWTFTAVLILKRIALCFAAQGDKGTCDGS